MQKMINGELYEAIVVVNSAGVDISGGGGGGGTSNPGTITVGQTKIVMDGVAVRLPSVTLANGLIIKSKSTNSSSGQTVGGSTVTSATDGTGNGYVLDPGEAASFGVTNANAIYVNGSAGDVFSFQGN